MIPPGASVSLITFQHVASVSGMRGREHEIGVFFQGKHIFGR